MEKINIKHLVIRLLIYFITFFLLTFIMSLVIDIFHIGFSIPMIVILLGTPFIGNYIYKEIIISFDKKEGK